MIKRNADTHLLHQVFHRLPACVFIRYHSSLGLKHPVFIKSGTKRLHTIRIEFEFDQSAYCTVA